MESDLSGQPINPYVLGLDVGTTTLTCLIYDRQARVKGHYSTGIELLHPQPGWTEMDPNVLWEKVQTTIKGALENAGLTAADVTCMGITSQRNTFIMWDKETGENYHNFNTWQDLRCCDLVKEWNKSFMLKSFNGTAKLLHFITRSKRFQSAAFYKFQTKQVTMRLIWMMENNPKMKKRIDQKMVNFGTIDTWLLWKLTGEKVYAMEYTQASSFGFFDPFLMDWSTMLCSMVGIPLSIFPPMKDTSGLFGYCDENIFGASIPITAMVADQQGAMFSQCCFNVGDLNCSMGTGTFLDINTGSKPHAGIAGLYPLVGWKIGEELVFVAEGGSNDTGRCIDWAKQMGFFDDPAVSDSLAQSVQDSNGVHFIPAFSGLQAPFNDDKACASLIGISLKTTPAHIVRAILESLAFRVYYLYVQMLNDIKVPPSKVCRVDGGVSRNNFLMQLISNLTETQVDRPKHIEMACLGCVFLAGLAVGVWKDKEELRELRKSERVFTPQDPAENYQHTMSEWQRALKRTLNWYKNSDC